MARTSDLRGASEAACARPGRSTRASTRPKEAVVGWLSVRHPLLKDYALDWLDGKTDIEPQTRKNYKGALDRYLGAPPWAPQARRRDAGRRAPTQPHHERRRPLRHDPPLRLPDPLDGHAPGRRRPAHRHASPCEAVKPPKESRTEPQPLTEDEVRNSCCVSPRHPVLRSRARRLRHWPAPWRDSGASVGRRRPRGRHRHVRHAVEQIGPDVRLKEPKSERGRRDVKLSDPVVAALKTHRAHLNRERLAYGGRTVTDGEASWPMWADRDLVFPSLQYQDAQHPMGRIWTPYAFSKAWRKAIVHANKLRLHDHLEAGGDKATFERWDFGIHRLRHTYATHCLRAGFRDEVVSRALGHSSSQVTRTFYSHVIDGEQAETATVTGAVISGGVPKTPGTPITSRRASGANEHPANHAFLPSRRSHRLTKTTQGPRGLCSRLLTE